MLGLAAIALYPIRDTHPKATMVCKPACKKSPKCKGIAENQEAVSGLKKSMQTMECEDLSTFTEWLGVIYDIRY